MPQLLVFGLDATGEPIITEALAPGDRGRVHDLARRVLDRCHAVEVWEGPLCVLRRRRANAPQG